jgi:hypothetical protein
MTPHHRRRPTTPAPSDAVVVVVVLEGGGAGLSAGTKLRRRMTSWSSSDSGRRRRRRRPSRGVDGDGDGDGDGGGGQIAEEADVVVARAKTTADHTAMSRGERNDMIDGGMIYYCRCAVLGWCRALGYILGWSQWLALLRREMGIVRYRIGCNVVGYHNIHRILEWS